MQQKKGEHTANDEGYKSDMNSVPGFTTEFPCDRREVAALRYCSPLANRKIAYQLFAWVNLPLFCV